MEASKEYKSLQERATIRSVPISATKVKDYTNFLNISTKLNGVGGSNMLISNSHQLTLLFQLDSSSLAVKKHTPVVKPPKSDIFKPVKVVETTLFKKYYDRGDLPIAVSAKGAHRKVVWKLEPELLDYHLYLPIFFEGLREYEEPYKFLADQGTEELLERGGPKLLPVLPQLILPIKKALSTKDHEIICKTLKKIQKLVLSADMVGEALVPYYRQILPTFNLFKQKKKNLGDKIDYAQRKNDCLGDLIQETLEILEKNGGEDAYINIKYMVPTYESCMF